MGSSIERRIRFQDDSNGNGLHERREPALVGKRLQERFFPELADDLGSNSTTDVQASHGFRFERKITRLCSIDGHEQIQCSDAQFTCTPQCRPRYDSTRVLLFQLLLQPIRLLAAGPSL